MADEVSPTKGSGKNLTDARRATTDVTDWIAELSPAQLDAPACYAAKGTTLRAKFPLAMPAGCHPLVRPNYAYFNKALPRSAAQVVFITPITRCFDTADKYNRDANSSSPAAAPTAR